MANKNFEIKHGLSVGGTERITAAGAGSLTNLTLSGNLTVNGTTVTLDASTLQVADKNIVLNYHASNDTSSVANGAGITIQDAVDGSNNATILWDASNDEFDFSHNISSPGLLNGAANSFIYLAGGNASNGGSNILLYGQSHSSDANTTVFRAGGTETMRITSSGLVGIGAPSPQAGLELASTAKGIFTSGNVYPFPTGNAYIRVKGTNAQHNWIGITGGYDQSSGSANLILQSNYRLVSEQAGNYIGSETQSSTSSDITFGKLVGGSSTSANATKSEFMRIDSNGNLLVGTTSTNGAVSGGRIFSNGRLVTTVSAQAHYFNRLSSDGDIVSFYKDSSAVGSIGTNGSRLSIGSGDVNLNFNASANSIYPISNVDGTLSDNLVDLGATAARFKDIHLRGGVYADLVRGFEDTDTYVNFAGNNVLSFITGASERVRIDASGNVGIGATPKAYHSDYKAIDINNSASVMGYTGNNGVWLMENLYYDGNWKHKNSDFSALVEMYDGVFNFYNTASGTAGATATLQNRLKIDPSGNVGIGETNPDRALHVNGGTPNVVAKFESTDNIAAIEFTDSGGSAEIGNEGSDIVLFPGGAEKFRVQNSTGYLIAQSASQVRLVLGSTGNSSNNTSNWIRGTGNELGLNSAGGNIGLEIGGSAKMTVNTAGQVLAPGGAVSTPTFAFIGDTNTGMTRPTGDTLQFVCGGVVKTRISGDGLLFNSDTAAANALDDYEEGTFDASITPGSGSYTLNSSYSKFGYTKIGRVVTITGMVVISGASGASGSVTIGDLPFEMLNGTERSSQTRPSIHIYANGSGAPASAYYSAFIAFNEGNRSGTLIVTHNNTHDATPGDWLTGGSDIFVNFSYHGA